MRSLLGGKGAGCAEMTRAGLPVPPGFTITTEACNAYYTQRQAVPRRHVGAGPRGAEDVEEKTGKKLGDPSNPLLVSVRSGAAFSMPGMMDTVLNLGLNDETVVGLAKPHPEPRFAQDAYRRFIQMYGRIVMDIGPPRSRRSWTRSRRSAAPEPTPTWIRPRWKRSWPSSRRGPARTGQDFPTDPMEQLRLAIAAVFSSWMGDRAVVYRDANKIPHNLGTAVNVQTMVFGNMGNDSGTGVAFTRNPSTGEHALYGDFLINAQGEDVVAGHPDPDADRRDARTCCPRSTRSSPRSPTGWRALSRRAGRRVHCRAGKPLHASDPYCPANGRRGGAGRRGHGARGRHHEGRGAAPRAARPRRAAPAAAIRSGREGAGHAEGRLALTNGISASPGAAYGQGDLRSPIAPTELGPRRREGHSRAAGDLARTMSTG